MASLGLRRLYVSGRNWLQPATRFSIDRTRHATSQWRVAKFSTADEYEDTPLPVAPAPVKLEQSLLPDAVSSDGTTDWSKSYSGLSSHPFAKDVAEVLLAPLDLMDIEMKPGKVIFIKRRRFLLCSFMEFLDGIIYLPEIKYRRILNRAFGPGAWGLAPRGETNVGPKTVSREYALICLGRSAVFFFKI